jgi:hypothetical protein
MIAHPEALAASEPPPLNALGKKAGAMDVVDSGGKTAKPHVAPPVKLKFRVFRVGAQSIDERQQ